MLYKKVAWTHDNVPGDVTRQRVTYDQLSLTQFIQGFTRNFLDESDNKTGEQMMWYLNDLTEDVTEVLWASAKAAHSVLLCEKERGTVCWSDTSRIDQITGAHAQKHNHFGKQNWATKGQDSKKPCYCKLYQIGQCQFSKDDEYGGKIQKHISSFCLSQGHISGHPEKECQNSKCHISQNKSVATQNH